MGPLNVPALTRRRTNKCTNFNINPPSLTNITKAGDAAATLTVVDDAAALAASSISHFGPNVFKLDNSAGTGPAFAVWTGLVGNLNSHAVSAYVRGSGSAKVVLTSELVGETFSGGATYVRRGGAGTPDVTSRQGMVRAEAGTVVYFIANQVEEGGGITPVIRTAGAVGVAYG